jgi:tRNA threonylcarbamoyladenosine modification (KEOPS) complex Cgi121 subunit
MEVFETPEGFIAIIPLRLPQPLREIPSDIIEGTKILLFNSSTVISPRHAAIATYRALRAFKEGRNISRNLESEIAICLTGERQIHKAIRYTEPIGSDSLVSILISNEPMDWSEISTKICEALGAVESNEFGSMEKLAENLGVGTLSSCSERLELIILEKAALVELER